MEKQSFLTNEKLRDTFNQRLQQPSLFLLVNHAIALAVRDIHAGRITDPNNTEENVANQVLDKILSGRDLLPQEEQQERAVAPIEKLLILEEQEVEPKKKSKRAAAK